MSIARSLFVTALLLFLHPVWAQSSLGTPYSSALDLMGRAQKLQVGGDLEGAAKLYSEVITSSSNLNEYAHYYLGEIQVLRGQWSEAKNNYLKILELSPNLRLQQEAQFRLSQILLNEKSYSKARSYLVSLEKKSRREPQYPDIIFTLAKAERGLNNSALFCRWARKLYSKYPDFNEIKNWSLNLYENDFLGSKTKCIASREDQRSRIKNLQWAGFGDEAKKEIDGYKSLGEDEKGDAERLEVQYLIHEGEITKALELLLAHYDERKLNFNYLMGLATVAAKAGEVQAAVGSYYQAYKVGGKSKLSRQALYQAAFMSYQFQDYDGAYRRFQEFMKVFPSSGLSRDAKWHLAWIRYLRADYDGAYRSFQEIRNASSGHRKKITGMDRVNYWMGMALLKQKKYEEARVIFESMSKDQLLGYYAVAAQFRIKKLDQLQPKKIRRGAIEATRRLSRFSMSETLMSSDDAGFSPVPVSEELESEENLNLAGIPEESTEESPAEELTQGDRGTGVADGGSEEEVEVKTSFADPRLVKRFERARDLMILGLNDWAKWDLYDIERKTSNKEYLKTLMTEYETVENFQRSSYIGQVYFGAQRSTHGIEGVRYLWEHTYPKAYLSFVSRYSQKFEIPQELLWGIMRAESQYKRDVISPVGALGLMQVMPNTGQKISQILGEKNEFSAQLLLQPEMAIKIGAKYLSRLMKKFDNNIPLVAASYNAGPHRVRSWLSSFGELEMDEFIEHIPFLETRNYVKKVVSNFFIYNQLYNSKKELLSSLAEPNKVRIYEPVSSRETWEDN